VFRKLKPIWALAGGQRLRYGAAIASLVVASCFLYLPPLVPQIVIDGVIAPPEGGADVVVTEGLRLLGGRDYLGQNLWLAALLIVGLTLVAGVFTYLRGRWSAMASEAIARSVRERVYDHLQHLPCTYFDRAKTGDLVQRATSDVETLRVFLSTQVVEIGRAVIMLTAPIPLMLAIDFRMTIASLVLIPIVTGFSLVYFRKVQAAFLKTDESEGRLTTTVQENLTGIRVVRAFARQDFEKAKFDERIREYRDLDFHLYQLHEKFWSISDCLCFLQKALVVGVGIALIIAGELGIGAFFFFLTAVSLFIWPVRMMGRILNDLGKAMVALGRLQEILEEPPESVPDRTRLPAAPEDLAGSITFDRVTFAHCEGSPVLENVSFKVEPGQTLALLGPSGSGKSTIVNLLLRLYDYDEGSIRLDEHELRTLDRSFVRGQTAVVMQEPFLFSKTLRENLTLGRPAAGEDDVLEAASIACVHEAILAFDEGYDTRVGERGVTLSGGQRQRVALARALLQAPAILVLDDALSAVDAETETLILEALRQRHGRHTTLVIAHRLSTLMHADRILVLEHGRVVQSGTHEELRGQDGLYRRLWSIQNEHSVST